MPIHGHVRPDYVLPFFGHRLYLVPLIASLFCLAALAFPVMLAVHSDRLASVVFVDDVIACGVEACVWSQLTNWASLLLAVSFYMRCKVVRDFLVPDHCGLLLQRNPGLNDVSLRVGLVAASSLFIAANFGEGQVYSVHVIGVWLATISAIVYWWLQVRWLKAQIDRTHRNTQTNMFFMTLLGTIMMRASLWSLSGDIFDDRNASECRLSLNADPDDSPYILMAAIGQWMTVFGLALLPLTFVNDFRIVSQKLEEQAKWMY